MIEEYTRYRIPKERSDAFAKAYDEAAQYLVSSPACVAYELTHCVEENDRYILRIEWRSTEDHLQRFRKEPRFKEFFKLVQPFFDDIEEMQHYELTGVVRRL